MNIQSLFSKYFSESGRLVQKLFAQIRELLRLDAFLFVLFDEVESMASNRRSSSNEPNDAIRVVNAVLTQIDQLRREPNVVLLATSNITDAIDPAFLDRSDIVHEIRLPTDKARRR